MGCQVLYPVDTIAPPNSGPLVPAGRPAPRHPRCCPVPARPPCRTDTTYSSRSRDPPGGSGCKEVGLGLPPPHTAWESGLPEPLPGPPRRGRVAWRAAPPPPWLHTAQGQQLQVMGETSPGAGVPWDRAICGASCPHCLIHLEQLHASSDKILHISSDGSLPVKASQVHHHSDPESRPPPSGAPGPQGCAPTSWVPSEPVGWA